MTTYLLATDGEKYDAAGVEHDDSFEWSCSKTAVPGDLAQVYVIGSGIAYEWEIDSAPNPDPDEQGYYCNVKFVKRFDRPIALREILASVSRAEWGAPYTNFRGFRSIRVPDAVADRLRAGQLNRLKWYSNLCPIYF